MKRPEALRILPSRLRTSAEQRIARLRRTIAAERELLGHPVFEVGAAHVIMHARLEIRRIERLRSS
jgi:hypothetical protein